MTCSAGLLVVNPIITWRDRALKSPGQRLTGALYGSDRIGSAVRMVRDPEGIAYAPVGKGINAAVAATLRLPMLQGRPSIIRRILAPIRPLSSHPNAGRTSSVTRLNWRFWSYPVNLSMIVVAPAST